MTTTTRIQMSPVPPRVPTGDDPSQRDASVAGAPPSTLTDAAGPDNQLSSQLEPDASRISLPLEIERALRLFDEIADLGVGDPQPQLHHLPRSAYDALPGSSACFSAEWGKPAFWIKALWTPAGRRCPVFTFDPPISDAA